MCHKTAGLEVPSAAHGGGTVEVFLNMRGHLRLPSPVLWQGTHQLKEPLGGGSRLRLRQCRAQLRHDLIAHCNLNLSARVFSHPANQFGQSFACFADREFHSDEMYKGVQTKSNGAA